MGNKLFRTNRRIYLFFIFLVLIAIEPHGVHAQGGRLSIHILRPREQETFYAGPQSWLYSIEIVGWIVSQDFIPEDIQVTLEVIQEGEVLAKRVTQPIGDGWFWFAATVNPEGNQGDTSRILGDCVFCHFRADLDLPRGNLTVRVTATDPNGWQALDERHIVVDLSRYIEVPVSVELIDDGVAMPLGLPVVASTRIYMWRARHTKGLLNEDGVAIVPIEVLSEHNLDYFFYVEPSIIEGVFYEGMNVEEVAIPPSGSLPRSLVLEVSSRRGQIICQVNGSDELNSKPLEIIATDLLNGTKYFAHNSGMRDFNFQDIPFSKYLISANLGVLESEGYYLFDQLVDLTQPEDSPYRIALDLQKGSGIFGQVTDTRGNTLPFGWVTVEQVDLNKGIFPGSGEYLLPGLGIGEVNVVVIVPGFYSQIQTITLSTSGLNELNLEMVPHSDTQFIPWDDGEIVIPSDSDANVQDGLITLERGWLWGKGGGTNPWIIRTANIQLDVTEASIALEKIADQVWLYVMEGHASVKLISEEKTIDVFAGQMLVLSSDDLTKVLPLEAKIVAALHGNSTPLIYPSWEPTFAERLKEGLSIGAVGFAQMITLVTYSLILIGFILVTVIGIKKWMTKLKHKDE